MALAMQTLPEIANQSGELHRLDAPTVIGFLVGLRIMSHAMQSLSGIFASWSPAQHVFHRPYALGGRIRDDLDLWAMPMVNADDIGAQKLASDCRHCLRPAHDSAFRHVLADIEQDIVGKYRAIAFPVLGIDAPEVTRLELLYLLDCQQPLDVVHSKSL